MIILIGSESHNLITYWVKNNFFLVSPLPVAQQKFSIFFLHPCVILWTSTLFTYGIYLPPSSF